MVRDTLTSNADLKLAALDVELSRGRLMAAAGPFDSALDLSALASRGYQFSSPTSPPMPATVVEQLTLATGWSRRFRNGLLIAPVVSTTQTRLRSNPRVEDTRASVQLRTVVPLLRDLGGTITAAPEQAARADYGAAVLDEGQGRAAGMLRAAAAYWAYLAASRRVEVATASQNRADTTAAEIAALVKADERTRADLAQAQGTLASRRANRIAAEQALLATWQEIAVLTGSAQQDLSELPAAATDFPGPGAPPSDGALSRWIQEALARRLDLAAARRRLESAEVLLRAARNELWPRLDLELSGGFSSQVRGPGLGRLPDSLYRDIPGADVALLLSLQLPIERSGARGRLAQASAAHQQERISVLELERRIRLAIATAFEAVKRSLLALRESELAVKLLQQTVDVEKQKFRQGLSTLFAVIQAEDSLTSALLAKIEGQQTFALAIASLQFETGALVRPGSERDLAAAIARLSTLP